MYRNFSIYHKFMNEVKLGVNVFNVIVNNMMFR